MAKATPKKAAPKKAAPKKAAVAVDDTIPSKLVAGKKDAGGESGAIVYEAAKLIQKVSGKPHVSKGSLNLFLCQVTGAAESTDDARVMVEEAFDAGALKAA